MNTEAIMFFEKKLTTGILKKHQENRIPDIELLKGEKSEE